MNNTLKQQGTVYPEKVKKDFINPFRCVPANDGIINRALLLFDIAKELFDSIQHKIRIQNKAAVKFFKTGAGTLSNETSYYQKKQRRI